MTNLAKEKLLKFSNEQQKLQRYKEQLVELNAIATNTTTELKKVVVTSSKSNSVDGQLARISDLKSEIIKQSIVVNAEQQELKYYVNSLSDESYVEVITLRYFENLPWFEVWQDMHCSQSKMYRLHDAALKELNEMMKVNESNVGVNWE